MKNYKGMRFGRLEAISYSHTRRNYAYWTLKCDCGETIIAPINYCIVGDKKSCGCLHMEHNKSGLKRIIHGDAKTGNKNPLYILWMNMKNRCYNKNNKSYKNYGLRGISICQEWLNSYLMFKQWALKNGYKKELTIERKNVNGNYESENCCFIELSKQTQNKTNTKYVEYNGEKISIVSLAKYFNVDSYLLRGRLKCGWNIEKALIIPKNERIKKCRFLGQT